MKVIRVVDLMTEKFGSVFKFKKAKGNKYIFKRIEASNCSMCKRSHINDNTVVIAYYDSIKLFCRKVKTAFETLWERPRDAVVDQWNGVGFGDEDNIVTNDIDDLVNAIETSYLDAA
jgi:hypothetical protein